MSNVREVKMVLCSKCGHEISSTIEYITCLGCESKFHFECSGVSATVYNRMSDSKRDAWRCRLNCKTLSRAGSVCGPSPTTPDSDKVTDILKKSTTAVDLKSVETTLAKKLDDVTNLFKRDMEGLKNELSSLKTTNTGLIAKVDSLKVETNQKDDIIHQLKTRLHQQEEYDQFQLLNNMELGSPIVNHNMQMGFAGQEKNNLPVNIQSKQESQHRSDQFNQQAAHISHQSPHFDNLAQMDHQPTANHSETRSATHSEQTSAAAPPQHHNNRQKRPLRRSLSYTVNISLSS